MRRRALVLVVLALAAGCSDSQPAGPRHRTLTVFAAASLTKAFTAEGKAYESSHPGTTVEFSFAGSQTLVAQVEQGAPAAVLATADVATITSVADKLAGPPEVFAHNQLALVTAVGNPLKLRSLQDLRRHGLKVVLAGPTVPVGKAAAKALKAAGVSVHPVSLEDAVTGVVTKVRLGEADAGIAYVTDLTGAKLGGAPLPGTTTSLAIAAVTGHSSANDATAFISFVRGEVGQQILRSFGFQ